VQQTKVAIVVARNHAQLYWDMSVVIQRFRKHMDENVAQF
jgi:hypothetical protein